jgi:hypothetical protein
MRSGLENKKHIVCYSGGHSSALVAVEVVRKYGKENVILLNHDIHASVESEDIKRFKKEVADYLELEITYANHPDWDSKDQFDVVREANAFKVGNGTALCTNRLKTAPFDKYLKENFPVETDGESPCVIYYGFDANEPARILRRSSILGTKGYLTAFPLAHWPRTIQSTKEIGIEPPNTYNQFKHANCIGCLKAGRQHWYIVYCTRPDLWEKAKSTEDAIGYSIIKDIYLDELEPKFELMKKVGVVPTEHLHHKTFWKQVADQLKQSMSEEEKSEKPCECVF